MTVEIRGTEWTAEIDKQVSDMAASISVKDTDVTAEEKGWLNLFNYAHKFGGMRNTPNAEAARREIVADLFDQFDDLKHAVKMVGYYKHLNALNSTPGGE